MSKTDSIANSMQVTSCHVFPLREPMAKTNAFARITLNDSMQLTGLRIVDGSNGLFVLYPNDPSYKGEDYRSLFYPITRELRDHIEQTVIQQYHKVLSGEG